MNAQVNLKKISSQYFSLTFRKVMGENKKCDKLQRQDKTRETLNLVIHVPNFDTCNL